MVSSISSSTATQATYAPTARKTPDETVATPGPVPTTDEQDSAAPPTQSAESAASARLGDQLNAQADASRVQRAVDEAGTESDTTTATESTASSGAAAPAPTGGAAPAASTSTSATASTTNDYFAEADTDSDKTVSDDEQAAYETKLRQQAEAAAATKAAAAKETAPQDALTAEVRATYGVDEAAEPVLNITA